MRDPVVFHIELAVHVLIGGVVAVVPHESDVTGHDKFADVLQVFALDVEVAILRGCETGSYRSCRPL